MSKKSNDIVAVDLFCGVGGLTRGLRRAGISVALGVDVDPNCEYPFEWNNHAKFRKMSVSDVTAEELNTAWKGARYRLLAGCAPCQPFSTYSQAWDPSSDERWPLLLQFGRLVKETRPDFVTMENVPKLQQQEVFVQFKATLESLGYGVSDAVVNCADYGVPQARNRLVLLAARGRQIALAPPRPGRNPRTVRQEIGKLPALAAGGASSKDPLHRCSELSPLNLARIKVSVPGGSWKDWPDDLRTECHSRESGRGYVSVYGRMNWDEPAPTVTTQFYGFGNGRFGHPEQERAISLREGAMLQSFPKGYRFVKPGDEIKMKTLGRLIGNAVPVKLGEAIGRSIVRHVESLGRA